MSDYTDNSFITDIHDYKSQLGYVFMLNGGAVVWKSFQQNTGVDSTSEAKYDVASVVSIGGILDQVVPRRIPGIPNANKSTQYSHGFECVRTYDKVSATSKTPG